MATLEEYDPTPNVILILALFAHALPPLLQSDAVSIPLPGAGASPQHRTVGDVFFRRRGSGFFPLARKDKW